MQREGIAMKKKLSFIVVKDLTFLLIFIILLYVVCIYVDSKLSEDVKNNIFGIPDRNLYNSLIKISNKKNINGNDFIGLSELNLSGDDIKSIWGLEKLNLSNIRKLDLNNNFIQKLDYRNFSTLINLKELNLEINEIKQIKDNTFINMTKLEKINLNANTIKSVGYNAFAGLNKLQILDLQQNELDKLQITYIPSLRVLKYH